MREEPELTAPDMTAKSGATPASAGSPKLSMRTQGGSWEPLPPGQQPPGFVPPVTMTQQVPSAVEEEDPFGSADAVVHDSASERKGVAIRIVHPEPVFHELTKLACLDARKSTTDATSSGVAKRPAGIPAR